MPVTILAKFSIVTLIIWTPIIIVALPIEIGKTRPKFANNIPLMNKLLEYQKSEKNFEHVLSQDSLFSDVLYQYALLQRYRDKYHQAIWLAQRQLELKPDLLAAQIGMLRIYRHYIVSQSEDNAIEWLQRQPWQQAAFLSVKTTPQPSVCSCGLRISRYAQRAAQNADPTDSLSACEERLFAG